MWATLFASAIVLGLLMFFTSGDIPREDEWDTPGDYLVARANGTTNFASLFRQHNESRIVISQLLAAFITVHWGWNQHVLHAINWAITLLSGFLFVRLVRRTLPPNSQLPWPLLLIACSAVALVFTPVQWRNLLFSDQVVVICIPCLILAGVSVNLEQSIPTWVRYTCAGVFSLVASFCFINGLMLWFLLWPAPFLMIRNRTWRVPRSETIASVVHFALATTVIVFYFKNYYRLPGNPPLSYGLLVPHRTMFFALTWLAGPLFPIAVHYWDGNAYWIPIFVCGGLAGLVGFLFLVYIRSNWKAIRSLPLHTRLIPFGILLVYSLLSAISVSLARVAFGVFGNVARYSTVPIPAYLGLVGILIVGTVLTKPSPSSRKVLPVLAIAFSIAVLVAGGVGSMGCLLDKQASRQAWLSLAIRTVCPGDPLLSKVYPFPAGRTRRADTMERLGLLPSLPSFAWVGSAIPAIRKDGTYRIRVEAAGSENVIKGTLDPSDDLEADDILLLWNNESMRPVTAFLAPARGNYPGKDRGSFEIRYTPHGQGLLLAGKRELRLARPRTQQVWRLLADK
jgi:hypothetical protein